MNMQEDLHFGIGRKRKKSSIGLHDADKVYPLEAFQKLDIWLCRQLKFLKLAAENTVYLYQIQVL